MMKTKQIIATITAVLVVSMTLASISSFDAKAQEVTPFPSREKVISVTGIATTQVEPDLLHIQFGVEIQQNTAKEALEANTALMNKVIDALETVGVKYDEISTSSINIRPVYDYYNEPVTGKHTSELVGYKVSNVINVETKNLDLAAAIIDSGVSAGVNRVDNVYFTVSPQIHQQIKDELVEKAVLNAKSKAQKALTPLDYQIIGVKEVRLSEYGIPSPEPVYRTAYNDGAAMAMESTPVFSSDQDITTSANVVFIIGSN